MLAKERLGAGETQGKTKRDTGQIQTERKMYGAKQTEREGEGEQ